MGKEKVDHELMAALAAFAARQSCRPGTRAMFEDIIIREVAAHGHLACIYCGATMRSHVLRVLRKHGLIEHDFQAAMMGGLS